MKKKIIGIIAIVVVIAALLGVYFAFREQPTQGSKTVSVEVIGKEKSESYETSTDALYLRQLMDEIETLTYGETQSGFGPMVTEVNGERAVYEQDSAYWAFYVNGEYCNYGISDQPVNDGDKFQIVYTKAQ